MFYDIYNKLINNDIWPNHITNSINSEISFIINKNSFNKFQTIIENDFEGIDILYNTITKISMIGYGLTNTTEATNTINKIINENNLNLLSLETSQTKIGIVFNNILDNNILEIFHKELIK